MKLDIISHIKMGRPLIEILLNGIHVKHCVEADEELGRVVFYIDPLEEDSVFKGSYFKREVAFGHVEIILGDQVKSK